MDRVALSVHLHTLPALSKALDVINVPVKLFEIESKSDTTDEDNYYVVILKYLGKDLELLPTHMFSLGVGTCTFKSQGSE